MNFNISSPPASADGHSALPGSVHQPGGRFRGIALKTE